MKVKYTIITICAALAIILGGYFGISAVFNAYFNAGVDVYEETNNTDEVESAANEELFRCSYPLIGGWEERKEKEDYFYEKVKTLIEVSSLIRRNNFSASDFQEYVGIYDNNYNVIDSTVNNEKYRISAVFRYRIFYGFYVRPTAKPLDKQIKTAVEDLKKITEQDDRLLQEFFRSIQGFMDGIQGSISPTGYVIDDSVSRTMHGMMFECEDPAIMTEFNSVNKTKYSLYDCYQYGEKHILTDGKDTVLLSSVGGYGVAVFYDAINRRFCGINLITY